MGEGIVSERARKLGASNAGKPSILSLDIRL